ncbi:CTP synthase [Angomonas deanei]|uniref:CTP synthase (glutamine hydrolyzing) n=1 Tax=Angomonas deanei TaxID=59799 RepID=A0A7G2C6P8_9TRYP|nr:CTP synthase [Angomonas deanei]CAD2215259.1 Glutamine amidotransferase class-I/Peptidase C26, putative [Angomonas deanei]|eukprot:EPY24331.1 CTP synthase [Angomonas deanei]
MCSDIIGAPNVDCLYRIPVEFQRQGLIERLVQKLKLPKNMVPPLDVPDCDQFNRFSDILRNPSNPTVRIAFVGKYVTGGTDAYFSVLQCFEHCQIALGIKLDILYMESEELEGENAEEALEALKGCDGIFVPGGFGVRGIEGKVRAVTLARTHKIPYFGVCLGMQVALIEFARHVLGWADANSEEFDAKSTHQIVHIMDCDKQQMGANMHLGTREVHLVDKASIMHRIYSGAPIVCERHRHRYEVNGTFLEDFKAAGLKVTGVADPEKGVDGLRVEAVELPDHPHFLAVQYHPEFVTSPLDPSPPFLSFFEAASKKSFKWPGGCHPRRLPGGK